MELNMSSLSQDRSISIKQREELIKSLPCFSMLNNNESHQLALFMFERTYAPGDVIVSENDLVDCVYIVVSGKAEVSHADSNKTGHATIPIATINKGESIGLTDTGFFSTTGVRTAMVTAITQMTVLGLSIKDLHEFLRKFPHLQPAMQSTADEMLRMRLIKQSLPFHRLSNDRLMWLSKHVEEMTFLAGETIFKQGDEGDCCYLIRSGQVEIFTVDEQGAERSLATLTPPTLFGEATLITHTPRNASARALEESKLLVLHHSYLTELIESEKNVAHMFMSLMIDRSKPLQNPNVSSHPRMTADGQSVVILKNPDNGTYFKLSDQGQFIWQQLDGRQTMQDITLLLADKFNVFAPDVVTALISKLAKSSFVGNLEITDNAYLHSQPFWVRAMVRTRRILESRIAIGDADKLVSKLYNGGGKLLFSALGQVILAIVAILGMVAFGFATPGVFQSFKAMHDSWMLLILLVPMTLFSYIWHELGHALATKAFGYEVHYMGVGWYWFGPVAFTDTSDMWLSTRWPRIAVNLAGIYADILDAGIVTCFIYVIPNHYVQAFLWLFALYTYINAFRMLSPLQELDGYYVLMDLLERPRLRQSAVLWLVKDFPKAIREPRLFKQNLAEVYYWLAGIVYLILVTLLTVVLQTMAFKILGIHSSNPFVSLALPFFVVLISSLSIIADVRSQA